MTTLTLVPTEPKPVHGTQCFPSGCCPGLLMAPELPYLAHISGNDSSNGHAPNSPDSQLE